MEHRVPVVLHDSMASGHSLRLGFSLRDVEGETLGKSARAG
jgi:hypothetical protein